MKATGAQIRAARAFLGWTIADLAEHAGVGDSTVRSIESVDGFPNIQGGGMKTTLEYRTAARREAVSKVVAALEAAGIIFLSETPNGVGLRGQIKS